ncbi:hypothetical protein AWC38_SpisGene22378 [Stylophora pistillata]|uniref:DUF6570 domain-containing protein n=1 Tax=Stylophora pistillata TaxID=50429 RepID=A0A2B4RAJ8_STYPI|nr:hypothetical protein AWC38_SpisGene22378 [Stylophora pistillata]
MASRFASVTREEITQINDGGVYYLTVLVYTKTTIHLSVGGPFGGGGVPPIDGAATSNPWVSNMPMTQPFQGAAPYGGQDAPQVYGAATSNPRVSNMPMTQPFQGAGGPRRHFPTGDFMQHVMNLEKRVQNMERTIHPAGVADVTHTVNTLPRLQRHTATIKVNLKRKLQYKSSALSLYIRPHKVMRAAKWLMTNSSLYKDEGIVFDNDWINKYNIEIGQSNNDDNTNSVESRSDQNNASTDLTYLNVDEYDVLNEDEVEPIAGVTDTMLTATDFLEENKRQNILNVAPAE